VNTPFRRQPEGEVSSGIESPTVLLTCAPDLGTVRRKETTLYVTLAETRHELTAVAASHGWDLAGIEIFELAPPDEVLNPDWFEAHAGLDESGKGDFFGPLIAATVIGQKSMIEAWRKAA